MNDGMHPMNTDSKIKVFAYGGLILPESRSQTLEAEIAAIPVRLTGFERFWGFAVPRFHLTTVALRVNSKAHCAGAIFSISPEQLEKLDVREEGYDRIEVPREDITNLDSSEISLEGKVYTYVYKDRSVPSPENPITQSDVDAILVGSLREYGDSFTREIVKTTTGWEDFWINDRRNPRYPWSLRDMQFAEKIDQILKELIPNAFHQRQDDAGY